MERFYSSEKNTQYLISLLKQHKIKKIIVSPGAQNICFVGSVQNDDFFDIYSAPDERSAAYMACGMAESSGEPVVLSCTGATASRNYLPALTEAYYRKLPVLAVTSTKHKAFVGQNVPQVIDRSVSQNDVVKKSVYIQTIENNDDAWGAIVAINSVILELSRHGGGPAHIDLETNHSADYSIKDLPKIRKISRFNYNERFPDITRYCKIAVFIGAHGIISKELQSRIENFCVANNAVVLCDHTSNYHGKYKIMPALISSQDNYRSKCLDIDLLIDIGNISGAYYHFYPKEVWRINPDGEIRDSFRKLTCIFEMEEIDFFEKYSSNSKMDFKEQYYNEWKLEIDSLYNRIPELPLSNLWIAKELSNQLPENSSLHLAILNSLRSWNYYNISETIDCFSNTGGFGIDGPISTTLGSALGKPNKLHFLIVGDLAFFYDMNALGNRHFSANIRILLINNGIGTEFKNYNHKAALFGDQADLYMAAGGHYGNKSRNLVKHFVEDLGFEYFSAETKEEFSSVASHFVKRNNNMPIVFEVFTDSETESEAYKMIRNVKTSVSGSSKKMIKKFLGDDTTKRIKKFLRK